MALFSRDSWLVKNAAVRSQANEKYLDEQQRESAVFPPCGIVPFRGIVMYATPLCYQYVNTTELYYVFRSLYAQVSHLLSLLVLCSLVFIPFPLPAQLTSHPVLAVLLPLAHRVQHSSVLSHPEQRSASAQTGLLAPSLQPLSGCRSGSLGTSCMKTVIFPFFSPHSRFQVLTVWDRILAWDSLLLVPVIAASIISFREK
eukprot:764998-Hanusia_phi.AAC.6